MLLPVSADSYREAIIISPVADLLGQPHVHSHKKELSMEEYYHQIPFSGSSKSCWRLHQVLFNERVQVLEERGQEAKVRISNFYYVRDNESMLHDTYWISKKHLLYLDRGTKNKIDKNKFPPPISYNNKNLQCAKEQNVVTLKKPYYDKVTKQTYSVGTRFLAHPGQDFSGSFDRGAFKVYIYDSRKQQLVSTEIPKVHCIRNYFTKPEDQVHNFVQVLRSWTYEKIGVIPYVLGGFSWTQSLEENDYIAHKDPKDGLCHFHRPNWSHGPKQGFDCVGMIGRAAQLCEIPFFYKNTLTLMRKMTALKPGEKLREGDLIWFKGHVMVISCLKKNLIVEARGYDSGFGKVQELPIHKIFKGVRSLKQLREKHEKNEAVYLLDMNGKPSEKPIKFKILKIHSVFE